jgi:hypothetical protein
MTARELIRDALQEIGALAVGEAVSNADAQAALVRLNSMISTWQTERLMIDNVTRYDFSLVANQQSYTIGPTGADFTLAIRPRTIEYANLVVISGSDTYEVPLELIDDAHWADLRVKGTTSSLPSKMAYSVGMPLGTLDFWPVPSDSTVDVALYIPIPLAAGLTLDSVLTLAPEYEEAIRYNLAIRLAPVFGRPVDATIGMLATESKATVKRANPVSLTMRVDDAIVAEGAVFDIWTGGQT